MPSTRSAANSRDAPRNETDVKKKLKTERPSPVHEKKQRRRAKPDHAEWQGLQSLLQRFLAILIQHDCYDLLSRDLDDEAEITLAAIQKRLDEQDYMDAKEFKDDLDGLFQAILSGLGSDPAHLSAHERLQHFATSSLRLEVERLEQGQVRPATITEMDVDPVVADTLGTQTALFRPTHDGFIFSRASSKKRNDDIKLPGNIQEVTIHPTPPTAVQVPTLGKSVPLAKEQAKIKDRKVKQIQWLGYGPYSSFAPAYDSNQANVSYQSTFMGRAAKRFRKRVEKQRTKQSASKPKSPSKRVQERDSNNVQMNGNDAENSKTNGTAEKELEQTAKQDTDIDMAWLESQGLDAESIVRAAKEGALTVDDLLIDDPDDVNKALERNGQLIEQLLQYQEHRFGLTEDQWSIVNEKEKQLAMTLETRMSRLISALPPNATVKGENIQSVMARLPLKDAPYRGSLPHNKMFAFTSDKLAPPEPYANITPMYAVDRWRIVGDVPTTATQPVGPMNPSMWMQPPPGPSRQMPAAMPR